MTALVEIALANLIVAAILAVLASAAGLWGRRPAITHALWALVFVKLITPPFFQVAVPWPAAVEEPIAIAKVEAEPDEPPIPPQPFQIAQLEEEPPVVPMFIDEAIPIVMPNGQPIEVVEAPAAESVELAAPIANQSYSWPWVEMIAICWLAGSCVWLTLAVGRMWRFQRLLRFAQPAPVHVQDLAHALADCVNVRCPPLSIIPGKVSPMLWNLGRTPQLLLPAGLLERLSDDQLATLLAHELTHWRRRDDRIRWLEFLVLALYWWCPLVWWARLGLHQAEEECCDAWVVAILPDSAKDYALALVETVDFLSEAPVDLPLVASGLGRVRLLKRRLTMILQGKTPRALTLTGMLGVAGVGLLLLPLVPGWAQSQQRNQQGQQNRQEEQKNDRKKDFQGDGNRQEQMERLREEVRRLQEDVEKRNQELQRRMQELQRVAEQLRNMQGGGGQGGGQGGGKKGPGPGPGGNAGGQGGGGGGFPGGPGGGPGGGGGFPGGGPGGPGKGPFGPPPGGGGPMDQRLAEVERKLDMLLQEVRGLRGDMNKGPKGPAVNPRPGNNPNPAPNPRPKQGNNPGDAPPVPGLPRGIAPPAPPQPPAPPRVPNPGRED